MLACMGQEGNAGSRYNVAAEGVAEDIVCASDSELLKPVAHFLSLRGAAAHNATTMEHPINE